MKIPYTVRFIIYFFILVFSWFAIVNLYTLSFAKYRVLQKIEKIQPKEVGLVLGASVSNTYGPSDILKDRLDVAYIFYKHHKISKIIVSGDNSVLEYNEPIIMQKYLIELGVAKEDIYLDYAGFDTYDSIYRAKEIFGVTELAIFTQGFHLKRAVYIAKKLGLDVMGVETDLNEYSGNDYLAFREIFARIKAFFDADLFEVKSTFLGPKVEIITEEKKEIIKKDIVEN